MKNKMKSLDERIELAKLRLEKAQAYYDRLVSEKENGKSFRTRARIIMEKKNLTYEEVGKLMGNSRQYAHEVITKYRNITPEVLGRLAKALGVSTDYLIYGKED